MCIRLVLSHSDSMPSLLMATMWRLFSRLSKRQRIQKENQQHSFAKLSKVGLPSPPLSLSLSLSLSPLSHTHTHTHTHTHIMSSSLPCVGKGFPDVEDELNWHGKPLGPKNDAALAAVKALIKNPGPHGIKTTAIYR